MLRLLASWGVNRLSLGVQSLDDDMLALLGRPHDAAQALAAYDLARRAGFGNVSLDLIWGLPGPARLPNSAGTTGQSGLSSQGESRGAGRGTGQRLDDWLGQLARVADLGPEHISAYGLTVEPGTPLEAMLAAGRSGQPGPLDQVDRLDQRERLEGMPPDGPACPAGSPGAPGLSARSGPSAQPGSAARSGRPVLPPRLVLPDDDASAAMFLRGSEYLAGRGYAHYEISSFARPGFASRHNTGYWAGRDYLGLGPSAVSTLSAPPGLAHGAGPPILSGLPDGARARWENPRDLAAYEAAVAELGGPYPEGSGGPGGPGGPEYRPESRPAPREIEVIDRATGAAELVMLSLRTSAGLNLAAYAALAGREFLADRPGLPGLAGLIRALERDGLAVLEPGRLRLTRQGMLLSNAIIAGVLED
jgi:coproporphyrinogen III oxidase-like Fe-S oxidoreductase